MSPVQETGGRSADPPRIHLAAGWAGATLDLAIDLGAIWIRLLVSVACGKSRTGPVGLVKSPGIQTLIANEELALAA